MRWEFGPGAGIKRFHWVVFLPKAPRWQGAAQNGCFVVVPLSQPKLDPLVFLVAMAQVWFHDRRLVPSVAMAVAEAAVTPRGVGAFLGPRASKAQRFSLTGRGSLET